MSKKVVRSRWSCALYPQNVGQEWANRFWKDYPRASDLLLDFIAYSVKMTGNLACASQRGWEIWKSAVKTIDKQISYNIHAKKPLSDAQLLLTVRNTTIQTLSITIKLYIKSIETPYPDEAKYLTHWYTCLLQ